VPNGLLEPLDALTQGRLGDPEIVGGAREAAPFGGRDEVP
jgi:hypothetical protein